MIIITEDKQSHYLIKKFLIESGIGKEHKDVQLGLTPVPEYPEHKDVQLGLTPVSNPEEEIYTNQKKIKPNSKEFKALVAKDSKYIKLKNIARNSLLTLGIVASLWNAIPNSSIDNTQQNLPTQSQQLETEQEIKEKLIEENPEAASEIEEAFNFEVTYDVNIDKEKIVRTIIQHEGFRDLPYPDESQWSVGNGTKVYSTANFDNSEFSSLRSEYLKKRAEGKNALRRWVETKIPGWRSKFFKEYKIQNDREHKTSPITKKQAKNASKIAISKAIDAMQKIDYYDKLPENIKIAFIDMAYNMGPGFIDKFQNFNKAIEFATEALSNPNVSESDIEVANELFNLAADEIVYNINDDGSIKGPTKYSRDLPGRSEKNANLVRKGIESPQIEVTPKNFQNESLRKIYSHLFV
jgi:hypothetical protein